MPDHEVVTELRDFKAEAVRFLASCFDLWVKSDGMRSPQDILRQVMVDMSQHLLLPYTADDLRTTLFQMHPSKFPRLNGFAPLFYQRYWSTLGALVTSLVLNILDSV